MRNSKNDAGYERFMRKIFWQSICLLGISILVITAAYLFVWRGNIGDWLVSVFVSLFHMKYYDALHLYNVGLRQNYIPIFMGAVAVTFIVLLRFSLKRITRYFDSINNGINALIENDGHNIILMPEIEKIEKKLNTVRLTLEQRSRDAQLAEQRKNDLIMYLAHDLKTPLTSIIGYLSLLEEAPDMPPPQKAKYVHITLDKAYRLEQLIDEFFEITRYNLQAITLTKKQIDLYYMLVQIADEFYPLFTANGKQVVIHAPEDLTVTGDPDQLARVFNNILKNAAAYSEPNSVITIAAKIEGDLVTIVFKNAGGISKDRLTAIFDKFYRLDDARSSNTGGAGLGLAIAKEIVTAHGGRIYADTDGKQTLFTVALPVTPMQI